MSFSVDLEYTRRAVREYYGFQRAALPTADDEEAKTSSERSGAPCCSGDLAQTVASIPSSAGQISRDPLSREGPRAPLSEQVGSSAPPLHTIPEEPPSPSDLASLNLEDPFNPEEALLKASDYGNLSVATYFLRKHAEKISPNTLVLATHRAAGNGHSSLVEILIEGRNDLLGAALIASSCSSPLTHRHLEIALFCLNHRQKNKIPLSVLHQALTTYRNTAPLAGDPDLENRKKLVSALLKHPSVKRLLLPSDCNMPYPAPVLKIAASWGCLDEMRELLWTQHIVPDHVLQIALDEARQNAHLDVAAEIIECMNASYYKTRRLNVLRNHDSLAPPEVVKIRTEHGQARLGGKLLKAIKGENYEAVVDCLTSTEGKGFSTKTLAFCLVDMVEHLPLGILRQELFFERTVLRFLEHPRAEEFSANTLSSVLKEACYRGFSDAIPKILTHGKAGSIPTEDFMGALLRVLKDQRHDLTKQHKYKAIISLLLRDITLNRNIAEHLAFISSSKDKDLFLEDPVTRKFIDENRHRAAQNTQAALEESWFSRLGRVFS